MGELEHFRPVDEPQFLDTAHLLPAQTEQVPGIDRPISATTVQQREAEFFRNGGDVSQFGNIYASDILAYEPQRPQKAGDRLRDANDKQIESSFCNYGASKEFASSILQELHKLPENLQDALVKSKPAYSVSVDKDADSFLKQNPDIAKDLTEEDRQDIRHGGAFRDKQTHRLVFFENYLEGHANIPTRFFDSHNLRGAVAHEVEHVNDERHKDISQNDPQFARAYRIGVDRLLADPKHPPLLEYFAVNTPTGYGKSEAFAELSALKVTAEISRKDYSAAEIKHYFKELYKYVEQQIDKGKW